MGYRFESVRPSIDSISSGLIKIVTKIISHDRKWHVHAASAFPLTRYFVSYSPERHPTLWSGGTRPSNAEMVVCPETGKISLIDISLACSIVKSHGFAGYGVVPEAF
jgi:hypothetical protein